MTTLSLLGGDWEYQFEDQTVGSGITGTRMLVYITGVVRTTNEVYSAVAAAADDFQAMGFKNPMLPVTPNEYTLENQAFISRTSAEFLKEGTITANWSLVGVAGDNSGRGVLKVGYTDSVALVAGDVGRQVSQATTLDTGTLLAFDTEPDGSLIMWVRPDDSTPSTGDIFDGTGVITVVGGTGVTATSIAGISGQTDLVAFQAIGSVPVATEVYAVQSRIKLSDAATNTFQWWATDPDVSLGIVSTLVMTRNSGVLISAGDVEVFARKYTSLYDNFRLNIAAGGFSALPLASAPDINNTTGYRRTTTTSSTGTFNVGNAIYVGATFATATKKGVITAVTGSNPTVAIQYYLIGDLTDFAGSDALKEFIFSTQVDGDATATAGAPVANLLGPTDTASGEGGTVTITIGHQTVDHDNTGVAEPYSITIDSISLVPIAKVYERIKFVLRRGSDNTFWDTVASSVPGEQYRGVEALFYYAPNTGTMVQGEDIVNETKTGLAARLLSDNTAAAGESVSQDYITVTDLQPSTLSTADNDVWADSGSVDDVTVDTAGAGGAIVVHAAVKASPFGSFTGTQIFGAPGISYINPAAGDAQSYILTDDLGTLRTPPNTVTYSIANTRAGDRGYVARDTGTSGVIDKDQFGGSDATLNILSGPTFQVAGTIDAEVPTAGVIRVVETTLQQEHRYEYASRTTGAGGIFTLYIPTSGTGTITTASTTQIIDTGQLFSTGANPVKIGHLVRNLTGGKVTHVWEVSSIVSDTVLDVFALYGPLDATQDWDVSDTYEINQLIQAYDATDNVFDTILDLHETVGTDGSPGTMSNTFVKTPAADFGTVAQVRQGKIILPFEQNQTQGDGNTTVTAVRTPDTIAV